MSETGKRSRTGVIGKEYRIMKKIVLCCNAGMSTSMLVQKMREAAGKEGFECEINAYPISEVEDKGNDADVILLGPQVRFETKKVQKLFPEKPVDAIAPSDYGMLRGDKVLEAAKKMMGV